MIESVRGLVRPVVTIMFAGAFIAAAFIDAEAAKLLSSLVGVVVTFWFQARASDKATARLEGEIERLSGLHQG